MAYKIMHKFPTNQEFNNLFNSVGWGFRDDDKINKHRKSSCFAVCVYDNEKIIGMARMVGDGAYYTIFDVVTKAEYQGNGVGSMLMTELVKFYESIADDDTCLYLGASHGKEKFYEKFGFKSRPYAGIGAGMKYDPEK